jgi:hypothetical protein
MQNSRYSYAPRPTPTLTNSILKNRCRSKRSKPKFFKKLFAALKAVTRVLQTLVVFKCPPKTPTTTPKEPTSYFVLNKEASAIAPKSPSVQYFFDGCFFL